MCKSHCPVKKKGMDLQYYTLFDIFYSDIEESNQRSIINENDNHEKVWHRAITLFRNERYAESKELYETYISLNPENWNARGQYVSNDNI